MRKIVCLLSILLFLTACFNKNETVNIPHSDADLVPMELNTKIEYAKGFKFDTIAKRLYLTLRNPKDTTEIYKKIQLVLESTKSHNHLKIPLQKVALQSTTQIPFIEKLMPEAIQGLCFTNNVKSPLIKQLIADEKIVELLASGHIDYEKLTELDVDLTFVYPFDQKEIKTLEEMQIRHLLCFEYLENDMLAKAEWIKFFGVLLGKQQEANAIFDSIVAKVQSLKTQENQGLTLLNLPFGDTWNVPSGTSPTAKLLAYSGFDYAWKNELTEGNINVPMETIIEIGSEAPNWVIFASRPEGFSLNDLIAENDLYKHFKSVKNGRVYFCNTGTTPYFEQAILEPYQLVLDLNECVKTGNDTKYFRKLK